MEDFNRTETERLVLDGAGRVWRDDVGLCRDKVWTNPEVDVPEKASAVYLHVSQTTLSC